MWDAWDTVHFDQNLVYSPNYFKLEVRRHEAYLTEAATKCWNECVLTLSPTSSLHSHKQPIKHLPKAPTHQTSGSPRTTVPPFRGWVGKRATHVTLYMPFSPSLLHTHTHIMASMDIWGAFVKGKKKLTYLVLLTWIWVWSSSINPSAFVTQRNPHCDAWDRRTVKLVWMEN